MARLLARVRLWAGTSAQSIEQGGQVVRNRGFEPQRPPVRRMSKGKPIGVQGMAGKRQRSEMVRAKDIPPLAHQRVPPQPRLDPDLVPLAGFEPHFDE
jgi:hypothetical protein